MQRLRSFTICFLTLTASVATAAETGVVYQTGPISALMAGLYRGTVSCRDLVRHGKWGLGTFDQLDGEMIVLDGKIYAARDTGKVEVPDHCTTPFATVGDFTPTAMTLAWSATNYGDFEQKLDARLGSLNQIVMIKLVGVFDALTVRVAPRQRPPYRKLVEAVQNQPIFQWSKIKGTMIGFRFPSFLEGINVPGYHLHFVSDDRKSAGHVFQFEIREGQLTYESATSLNLAIPTDAEFRALDFGRHTSDDLQKVERPRSK